MSTLPLLSNFQTGGELKVENSFLTTCIFKHVCISYKSDNYLGIAMSCRVDAQNPKVRGFPLARCPNPDMTLKRRCDLVHHPLEIPLGGFKVDGGKSKEGGSAAS